MLAYNYRFHGHNSLRFVYKNGAVLRSQHLTIKYIANPKRHTPRAAVVVSKKVYKKAVGRNRIRRRLYEILRRELPKIQNNSDVVVIVTSAEVLSMSHAELEAELANFIQSTRLHQPPREVI